MPLPPGVRTRYALGNGDHHHGICAAPCHGYEPLGRNGAAHSPLHGGTLTSLWRVARLPDRMARWALPQRPALATALAHRPLSRAGRDGRTASFRPLQKLVERRAKRLAPVGQAVFHLGRHLIVNDAAHDAIAFHLAQLLSEHLLRDARNCPLQLREALHLPTEQSEEDLELPSTLEEPQRVLDPQGSRFRGVLLALTFW